MTRPIEHDLGPAWDAEEGQQKVVLIPEKRSGLPIVKYVDMAGAYITVDVMRRPGVTYYDVYALVGVDVDGVRYYRWKNRKRVDGR